MWDSHPGEPLPKPSGPRSRWVQAEAAKFITPDSLRRRTADAKKQIRALASTGSGRDMEQARKAHQELIQMLSERLSRAENQSS